MPCTKPSIASVRVPARMMPTRQILARCCAPTADAASNDVEAAAQPRCVRNSRRCIGVSQARSPGCRYPALRRVEAILESTLPQASRLGERGRGNLGTAVELARDELVPTRLLRARARTLSHADWRNRDRKAKPQWEQAAMGMHDQATSGLA